MSSASKTHKCSRTRTQIEIFIMKIVEICIKSLMIIDRMYVIRVPNNNNTLSKLNKRIGKILWLKRWVPVLLWIVVAFTQLNLLCVVRLRFGISVWMLIFSVFRKQPPYTCRKYNSMHEMRARLRITWIVLNVLMNMHERLRFASHWISPSKNPKACDMVFVYCNNCKNRGDVLKRLHEGEIMYEEYRLEHEWESVKQNKI